MEFKSWNFENMNFKSIQVDTYDETNQKTHLNMNKWTSCIFLAYFEEKPKVGRKYWQTSFFGGKGFKLNNLPLGIKDLGKNNSFYTFLHQKSDFWKKFGLNIDIFLKFAKNETYNFIWVLTVFSNVSPHVSICILLKFMSSKFQVSNTIKWLSYWNLNLGHVLTNTLYESYSGHRLTL